ncbi:MAG: hypothetical protein H6580_00345 [Flammeovirgaceae bacterium]|nr:hypothetical protein [Flammeovirgaceae bacterium]
MRYKVRKRWFFFDYIYFRITDIYLKSGSMGEGTAIAAITMIEMFWFGGLLVLISRLFLERTETATYAKVASFIGVVILVAVYVGNYHLYDGRYEELKEHWANESQLRKTVNGFLVVACIFISWIPLILVGLFW